MELQNMDLRGGSLQISTEVLGKIARCAALEVAGVAEVSCGSQNRKVKDFLERANVQSPVTVEMRDGTAGKGAGKRQNSRPEHDERHRQPCRPCDRGPCSGTGCRNRLINPKECE